MIIFLEHDANIYLLFYI